MELSGGGVRQQKPLLFNVAAKAWLSENAHWSNSTREIYKQKLDHLKPVFGKMLLSDISASDISRFQRERQKAQASGREINMETAVLRMILRKHRLWHFLKVDYRPMRERSEVGRALTPNEVTRLLAAAKKSRSRSLYPALAVLLNTGMRVSELRLLRWGQVDMLGRELTVGHSKTSGGEGRLIPLNQMAFETLVAWRAGFDNPEPDHYVSPSQRYGLDGESGYRTGAVSVWNLDPEKPVGSWKVAWMACRTTARVKCRLHDLRHTFVSRLAAAQVADSTLTALSGWMSRKMLERYSHVRNEAKRRAVDMLSASRVPTGSPQNHPQSETTATGALQ